MTPAPARARPRSRSFANAGIVLLHRIGRRTLLCSLGLFVLCVGLRVALLRRIPPPQPIVHDEFAYLLGADTFVHGRLANRPHPLQEFFETMHQLSRPVYASKYQPGQAAFLALGQAVTGSPYAGVVLGVGLMVAAMYWMLRAWAPPGWALLGGLFTLATFGAQHYWMQSYWGGAVAACGSALVVGAVGRGRASWAYGAGAALLLFTRPYEGAGLLAMAGVAIVWRARSWRAVRWPAVAILGVAVAFQAFYDWRLTGNPLRPPYVEHIAQYEVAPILWVLKPSAPKTYSYPEIANLHAWEMRTYGQIMAYGVVARVHHLAYRILYNLPDPFRGFWMAWIVAALWPDRGLRRLAWLSAGVFAALMLETWMIPHYEAPLIALALALMTRLGWRMWHMKPAGPVLVALFAVVYAVAAGKTSSPVEGLHGNYPQDRAAVIARLQAEGGQHVVVVRYAADHSPHREWVFNAAEIDAAPIVWARDRGDDNARLRSYFAGRKFWVLEPDAVPLRLTPVRN
jgi:hypothetical protein